MLLSVTLNKLVNLEKFYTNVLYLNISNILRVFFFITVPPNRPVIYDGKRRDRTTLLEAYNEGSDVNLICEASGGKEFTIT